MEYSEIVATIDKLNQLKRDYLLERGWKLGTDGRWRFNRPWGTNSYKPYEADLNDAVWAQARYEGSIE